MLKINGIEYNISMFSFVSSDEIAIRSSDRSIEDSINGGGKIFYVNADGIEWDYTGLKVQRWLTDDILIVRRR